MKKLAIKSALFLVLLLAASQLLIRPFVYHPFWGDPDYIAKYDHFFTEENDYNTVFIGSSRTFRHLDPVIFDSITGLNSFNFGIDGVGCPFNYFLTEDILQSKQAKKLDHIVLELFSPQNNLIEEVMRTDKVIFKYGWRDFAFTMRVIWQDNGLSLNEKWTEFSFHFKNLMESEFRFGQVHRIVNASNKTILDKMGLHGRGFCNGDWELKARKDSFLLKAHIDIQQHSELLLKRAAYNRKDHFLSVGKCDQCFDYHWNYLIELNQQCKENGIDLTLVIPPLMDESQALFMYRFLQYAPADIPILNYSSSDKYPAYYKLENVFDKGHLNTKGARIFTSTLANDFNHLLKTTE